MPTYRVSNLPSNLVGRDQDLPLGAVHPRRFDPRQVSGVGEEESAQLRIYGDGRGVLDVVLAEATAIAPVGAGHHHFARELIRRSNLVQLSPVQIPSHPVDRQSCHLRIAYETNEVSHTISYPTK